VLFRSRWLTPPQAMNALRSNDRLAASPGKYPARQAEQSEAAVPQSGT